MAARSPRTASRSGSQRMNTPRDASFNASGERREWSIASDVQAITPIVETVQGMCEAAAFSPRHCRLNIPVAMTEALSNAIMRGNQGVFERRVHIVVIVDTERLLIDVTDEGTGFDFETAQHTPDEADWLEREDGRGLFLMRSLMDHVESQTLQGARGHTLRLILRRT